MSMSDVFSSAAKAVEIIALPSQGWRRTLFVTRKLIDRLEDPRQPSARVERWLDRLLALSRDVPESVHPTAVQMKRVGRFDEALDLVDELWEQFGILSAPHALACAKVWYENAEFSRADMAMARAKQSDPTFLPVYIEEAQNQDWRGNANIARDAAQRIIELTDSERVRRHWERFIALQEFKFGRYELALESALSSRPRAGDLHVQYLIGVCLEELGREEEARPYYEAAKKSPEVAGLEADARQAALHLEMERPQRSLSVALPDDPSADLKLVRAKAMLRTARFREVIDAVPAAEQDLQLLEAKALALELSGSNIEATDLYAHLVDRVDKDRRDVLRQRLSRAATRAERFGEAVAAELALDDEQQLREKWLPEVDPQFTERLEAVLAAYREDELPAQRHRLVQLLASASAPANHRRIARMLGTVHAAEGETILAAQLFLTANPVRMPHDGELNHAYASLNYSEHYSEATGSLALQPATVLYESFHGAKIGCNPLALCLGLLRRDPERRWRHVWAVKDGAEIPPQLLDHPNVHFVRIGSYGYRLHLATAGYLINNVTFPQYYVRRHGQRYLNTWHGIPWKHLGRDFAQDPYSFFNIARNLIQATDLALPDEHTARKLIETQDVAGYRIAEPLVSGSPRVDTTLRFGPEQRAELLQRLRLDDDKPVVFFAPTWRGVGANADTDTQPFVDAVRELAKQPASVVLRVHHLVESDLASVELPANVRIAPGSVDTNELLALADVLVSDYSSLIFDFAPLNRPIVKYLFDLESYEAERGLYFSVDEVPGTNCSTLVELGDAVERGLDSGAHPVDWSVLPTAGLWAHEDGRATDRVLDMLLGDPVPRSGTQPKVTLVATGGLNPNGITRSLRNLFSSYRDPANPLHLVISRMPLANPEVAETAAELHSKADFTILTGLQTGTRQERLMWRRLESHLEPFTEDMIKQITPLMRRERRRHIGDLEVRAAVDFEGYTLYNAALIALGFAEDTRRIGVLHSEFVEEMNVRFPKLRSVGDVLRYFSALTSVSPTVLEENRVALDREFGVPPELLSVLPNTIDAEEIRTLSREPLDPDLAAWFDRPGPHVIGVGRLSTEKNQSVALEGLARALEQGEGGRYLLLGDGPLRQRLESLVRSLGLQDRVYFAGQRPNPYPAIARADALLMSSLHEGQPMVLLEALTLGTRVVSTDIPGARAVLEDGRFGLLVPEGVDGLLLAWEQIASGEIPVSSFDPDAYQNMAVDRFTALIERI